MSIEWVYILIIPLSRLLRFKALPRLCWFWCFFGIIVVSKQGDQIGPFFKGLGNTFSFKCSPNTCRIWGYFEKWYFLNKKMLQLIFGLPWTKLGYFGKNWATFYFNICSLLFPSFEILLCSMPLIYVMEKLFSVTEIRTLGCLQSNCL